MDDDDDDDDALRGGNLIMVYRSRIRKTEDSFVQGVQPREKETVGGALLLKPLDLCLRGNPLARQHVGRRSGGGGARPPFLLFHLRLMFVDNNGSYR